MPTDYAPKHFLRLARKDLLRDYFAAQGVLGDVPWDKLTEKNLDAVHEAWHALDSEMAARIESDFRRIHMLGTADGTLAILEEGRFHGLDLAPDFEGITGHVSKSLWTFSRHPRVHEVASILSRADHLNRRYWRKRKSMPCKAPDVSEPARQELADRIASYYWEHEGRGSPSRADAYLRGSGCHYVFVYPQDYSDDFVGYDENEAFVRRVLNPAFEVIFAYDPSAGSLDLFVRGTKDKVQALQEIFGQVVLKEKLGPPPTKPVYELNGLKSRSFPFPTDPADGVSDVRVEMLRLSVPDGGRITLEADPDGGQHAIYDLMSRALNQERLPLSAVNVTSAVIRMSFSPDGNGRPRSLSFRVSYPSTCNLRDDKDHIIARKYLREWGIESA